MAVVRVSFLSMKARMIIAGILLVAMVGLGLFAFFKFRDVTEPATAPAAESLVAGPSFDPGSEARLFGTDTEAFVDGLQQKVRAVDPTMEWREAFPDASCVGDGVETCVAPALQARPNAPGAPAGEGGQQGGLVDTLTGLIPWEVAPMLLLAGMFMLVVTEE